MARNNNREAMAGGGGKGMRFGSTVLCRSRRLGDGGMHGTCTMHSAYSSHYQKKNSIRLVPAYHARYFSRFVADSSPSDLTQHLIVLALSQSRIMARGRDRIRRCTADAADGARHRLGDGLGGQDGDAGADRADLRERAAG